jgi:hypothetical protein
MSLLDIIRFNVIKNLKIASAIDLTWSFPDKIFPIFDPFFSSYHRIKYRIFIGPKKRIGPGLVRLNYGFPFHWLEPGSHVRKFWHLGVGGLVLDLRGTEVLKFDF